MGEVYGGRYELVDMVGHGGMGSVWRAWDHERRVWCAAKVLRLADADSLLRFVREQSRRIDHAHVLAPYSWVGEDDKVLFTMSLVRGGAVSTLLGDHGPLPPSYVALLLDQLLDGLGAVHAAGLVHRDVKPANLLLDPTRSERPHLWLSDFGIAVKLDERRLTTTSAVIGTPGYLPPEALRLADPEPSHDLYAVGVCGIEMLTAQRPRPDLDAIGPSPEGVPERLWLLLAQLASADPAMRPASAEDSRRLLAAAEVLVPAGATLPWAALEDPVDVLDQLPELPPPWTLDGPGPVPADTSDVEDAARTTPSGASPQPTERLSGGVARMSRWAVRWAAASVVALAALVVWQLVDHYDPKPNPPGQGTHTTPRSGTGNSTPSESSRAPTTGGTGSGSSVRKRSGDPCTFTDVGNREDAVGGGRLECRLVDGSYQWRPVG